MLKHIAKLDRNAYEFFVIHWGQSIGRCWGTKAEGFSEIPQLDLMDAGLDLAIVAGFTGTVATTQTVALSNTTSLTANQWKGAELRLGTVDSLLVGYGTVTANSAIATTSTAAGLTFDHTTDVVTWAAHGRIAGTPIVLADVLGGVAPTGLAFGTVYYVTTVTTNTFQLATTFADAIAGTANALFTGNGSGLFTATTRCTFRVTWAVAANTAATAAWVHLNDKWKTYDNVRVLMPALPEGPGSPPSYWSATPFASGDWDLTGVTDWNDAFLLLPFSFVEGINGPGTAGAATSPTATQVSIPQVATANLYAGAYIRVGNSTARIATHDAANPTVCTLDSDGWDNGTPSAGAFELWCGHHENSPRHRYPGQGWRHPSQDPQPGGNNGGTGILRNRPNGNTGTCYGDRFGPTLPAASRLANQTGLRINVVHLAINSSSQELRKVNNNFGFQGELGWWSDDLYLDWTPGNPQSLFHRLKHMLEVGIPNAMAAEGNTKKPWVLCILGDQGQGDALSESGRETYEESITAFYAALQQVLDDNELHHYGEGVKVPVSHALISEVYRTAGTFTFYLFNGTPIPIPDLTGDSGNLVNTAITKFTALHGWGGTFDTDDLPKLDGSTPNGADPLHENGIGEARKGILHADTVGPLIDLALAMTENPSDVKVCNLALAAIGESPITSLDPEVDSSVAAALCARFYPTVRDGLLARRDWSFAMKRVALTAVDSESASSNFAYAVPADCLRPDQVLTAEQSSDYETATIVAPAPYSLGLDVATTQLPPVDFTIERNADGNRILYTDLEDAVLRYTAKVCDASMFPPWFVRALSLLLAADLAGPIVKGDKGAQLAIRCTQMAEDQLRKASSPEGTQRSARVFHNPRGITGR